MGKCGGNDSKSVNGGNHKVPGARENYNYLAGGFKYFLFSPLFGEESHFN